MKVGGLDDDRWPAALDLLLDGSTIELGGLVSITWRTQGVGADSKVRVDILSEGDPRFISRSRAKREIEEGMALVDRARQEHPRLQRLLQDEVVVWQYIYDYGMGSVSIASVTADGNITWSDEFPIV